MSWGIPGSNRIIQKCVGCLLGLAVAGYVGVVTVQGGVLNNPKRPKDYYEILKAVNKHQIKTQSASSLFKRSITQKGSEGKYLRKCLERGLQLIQRRLEYHKSLAYGQAQLRPGCSSDLSSFLSHDFAQFPVHFKIAVDSVDPKTIHFRTPIHYEMFAGAGKATAEQVFKDYLDLLVKHEWKVEELIYTADKGTGIISAERGKWHLAVGVWKEQVFPSAPVTAFWRMDRYTDEKYDADDLSDEEIEEAYDFIYILDYRGLMFGYY